MKVTPFLRVPKRPRDLLLTKVFGFDFALVSYKVVSLVAAD